MFNHEEANPLEGRGYAIKESDVNMMLEVVNRYIQKYRSSLQSHSSESDDQVAAVHIVTLESAAGTLRVGMESPKVVFGFPDSFSIGPLWKFSSTLLRDLDEIRTIFNQLYGFSFDLNVLSGTEEKESNLLSKLNAIYIRLK